MIRGVERGIGLTHCSYADPECGITPLPTPIRVCYRILGRCGASEKYKGDHGEYEDEVGYRD